MPIYLVGYFNRARHRGAPEPIDGVDRGEGVEYRGEENTNEYFIHCHITITSSKVAGAATCMTVFEDGGFLAYEAEYGYLEKGVLVIWVEIILVDVGWWGYFAPSGLRHHIG